MEKVFLEHGGEIKTSTPVKQLLLQGRKVKGVLTQEGEQYFDEVILNADFGHAIEKLIPNGEEILKNWKPSKTTAKKYSCSTFMYYLALDKIYPNIEHHTVSFADDYEANINAISGHLNMPDDFSIYIRNSSINDPTVSPEGQSGLYILVPTPNLQKVSDDWKDPQVVAKMKNIILDHLEKRCGAKDIRDHIVAEQVITPLMWKEERMVHHGATFSLAHNLLQLLLWRPKNKFDELDVCFIV